MDVQRETIIPRHYRVAGYKNIIYSATNHGAEARDAIWRRSDVMSILSPRFHDVRWCNVVFSCQQRKRYMQTSALQSNCWRDFHCAFITSAALMWWYNLLLQSASCLLPWIFFIWTMGQRLWGQEWVSLSLRSYRLMNLKYNILKKVWL